MPSAEVVTIGLPFSVFKLLTGTIALQLSSWRPIGYALLALGIVDAGLNAVNLVALLVARRRVGGTCLLEVLLRRLGASNGTDIGLALDAFLSFALIAVLVGFDLLLRISAWALALWNAAVVLNVVGAGVGRLLTALRSQRSA